MEAFGGVLTLSYAEREAAAWLGAAVVYSGAGRAARDEEPILVDMCLQYCNLDEPK